MWDPATTHAARGIGRASRPAHPLPAGRDHGGEGRRRSADRAGSLRRFPGRSPARFRRLDLGLEAYRVALKLALARAQVPPPPRRGREHLHHPERDGRPREDPPATSRPRPRRPPTDPTGTVSALSSLTAIQWSRQNGSAPSFTSSFLPVPALTILPNSVAPSPSGSSRHPTGRRRRGSSRRSARAPGCPLYRAPTTLQFNLFLPSGAPPAGAGRSRSSATASATAMHGAPWAVGSSFAAHGIATIAINVVGHGGGALGTLTVHRRPPARRSRSPTAGAASTRTATARSTRPKGPARSRRAASSAAATAAPDRRRPDATGAGQIQAGVDVDGDGADLMTSTTPASPSVASTASISWRSRFDQGRRAERPRRSRSSRSRGSAPRSGRWSESRWRRAIPQLLNTGAAPRRQPGVQREHPAARSAAIDQHRAGRDGHPARASTAPSGYQQSGNPVAYAPHLARAHCTGSSAKPVIIQFAKGDRRCRTRPPAPSSAPAI